MNDFMNLKPEWTYVVLQVETADGFKVWHKRGFPKGQVSPPNFCDVGKIKARRLVSFREFDDVEEARRYYREQVGEEG